MDPIILDTMNDIINQVDAREWRRVNEHRDRMMKKWKKEKEKVEYLQEHYDKTMSEEHGWANHLFAKQFEAQSIENEKLKEKVEDSFQKGFDAGREEYEVDKEYLDEKDEEIERLTFEIKLLKRD